MDELITGYRRFRAAAWPERRRLFENLAERGQRPRTMVVACADSRVDPAMIFDAAPGDIFVVRNVANLVPPYAPDVGCHGTGAALEFGVLILQVQHLVVLGHGLCGGIRALLEGPSAAVGDFLGPWIATAARARNRVLECAPADPQLAGEHAGIALSLENLLTYPWIAERVTDGRLRLHGAHFDVRNGVLAVRRADGDFAAV
jgi:carbonic anhydrase